jgi:hypothetical protein
MKELSHFPTHDKPEVKDKNPTPVKEFGAKKTLSPEAKMERFIKLAKERIPGDKF